MKYSWGIANVYIHTFVCVTCKYVQQYWKREAFMFRKTCNSNRGVWKINMCFSKFQRKLDKLKEFDWMEADIRIWEVSKMAYIEKKKFNFILNVASELKDVKQTKNRM